MSKIRINELARQLEIPSHAILEMLPDLGVTEKKTHSSSVDEPVAVLIRKRLFGEEEESVSPAATRSGDVPEAPASIEEPPPVPRIVQPPVAAASAPQAVAEDPAPSADVATAVVIDDQPRSKPAPIRPPLASG